MFDHTHHILSCAIANARTFAAPRDDRKLSLRANFSWTFVGNVVYAGCQWGMLTVLAKIGSPEMVGQFSLGIALGAPIVTLSQLQLRQIQATDVRREYDFADYFALRLVTSVLAFLVIAGIALLAGYRAEMVFVILALGLYKTIQSFSDVFYGLMQQRERMDYIARALMLKGPLSLLSLGILVYVTRSVAWGILGMTVVYLAVFLAYECRNARLVLGGDGASSGLRPRWQPRRLTALVWLALPLALVMMLISLNSNIPRYAIERILGERELGFFAAMAYLQVVGTTVVSALGQSASPRLAEYYAKGRVRAFRVLLLRLVASGAGLGVAGVLSALVLGRPLLVLLYTPEYAQYVDVFVLLMAASGFSYVTAFLGYGMTSMRIFWPRLVIGLVTIAIIMLGCTLLIPRIGLLGAAISLLASSIIDVCLRFVIILRALINYREDKGIL